MQGRFNNEQTAGILPFIKGRVVHDLGAGDLGLSEFLVWAGAEKVIAIERHKRPDPKSSQIEVIETYFEGYHESVDVAFMSWPVNWVSGLHTIAERANTIIYLGKNTDGSACGDPLLFTEFKRRWVHVHLPDRPNTLIVYGQMRTKRELLPEERAVLETPDYMWGYDELMGAFKKGDFVCYNEKGLEGMIGEGVQETLRPLAGRITGFAGDAAIVQWDGQKDTDKVVTQHLDRIRGRHERIMEDDFDEPPGV